MVCETLWSLYLNVKVVQVHNNYPRNASYAQWYHVKNIDVFQKRILLEEQMAGHILGT